MTNRRDQIANLVCKADWPNRIPDEQWEVYDRILGGARRKGIPFAIGGGFATISYTGQWRNTKDLDVYVVPKDKDAMVEVVTEAGLTDLYDEKPYERHWIYRAHDGNIIVDTIFSMANHRSDVDEQWLTLGPELEVRGDRFRLVPPEETLWAKLYVMQRDRSDWPDALNLLCATGAYLDYDRLLARLGEDAPLLGAALSVFGWLAPDGARELPSWLWEKLHAWPPNGAGGRDLTCLHASRLDTRPWFQAAQQDQPQ